MTRSCESKGTTVLWKTLSGGEDATERIDGCNCVRFHRCGRFALCASGKIVRIWNVETGFLVQSYPEHRYEVAGSCYRHEHDQFLSCAGNASFVWDIATARMLRKYATHSHRVNSVCVGGISENVLISGSYDTSTHLYDLRDRSKAQVQALNDAKDSITTVLSPVETEIWTASVDGFVRVYDVRKGSLTVDNLHAPVSSLCMSNDQECIVASTLDSSVQLLDKNTGELLSQYRGHINSLYKLECAILFDDSTIVSGSENGHVYFWDLAGDGGSPLCRARTQTGAPVSTVACHPSDSVVMTGNHHGSVQLWRVTRTDTLQLSD